MPENQQPASSKATNESSTNKQVVPPSGTVANPSVPVKESEAKPSASQQDATEKLLPRFERPEWVIVYITAGYALISWFTLSAIKRQANTMDRQAAEASKSSIEATSTATGTLRAIEEQARLLARQVETMDRQLEFTRQSADAATTAVEVARLDQRAWISVTEVREGRMTPGERYIGLIRIKNTGRTPARNVRISINFDTAETKSGWNVMGSSEPDVTLPPDGEISLSLPSADPFLQSIISRIRAATTELFCWGQIEYRILDSSIHKTQFSFVLSQDSHSFERCAGLNEAD